ncbi:INO80 complex subunit C isoform X2 [Hemicordylus capensis]|uniref:INO80 complex subunit C isoform X2 n=1 Tax=Hemicordylus capensis TaxID=884348 RepID=UPI0023039D5D|nr:INO80 complex subunit C isoform X2 [Hemicordylus capensis]
MADLIPTAFSPATALAPTALSAPGAGTAAARGKKRSSSPGNGSCAKKKRLVTLGGGGGNSSSSSSSVGGNCFQHSGIGGVAAGKKNRTWKNLKQILASEKALPWQLNDPSYFSIDAPLSCKPAKKYSDISGLPANYTDPQSKLRFSTIEEFAYIRMLPSDVVTGYLTLRKATAVVP